MIILGIESSCDETAAAVVEMGEECRILSSKVASQIETHKLYGGVVPEIASRAHTEAISSLTYEALEEAGISLSDIDLIGVTATPGLIGALLVGVNFAKGLAFSSGKPLVAVNHIRGHIAANYFTPSEIPLEPPFFALVASGGHTSLINVKSRTEFETVGRTRDDAMGEAFDKVARVMGMPYPGGAEMDEAAKKGDHKAVKFPEAAIHDDTLDFSFSGLKTAVINHLHRLEMKGEPYIKEDIAASFTASVVSSVLKKLGQAHDRYGFDKLVIAGGCSANSHLRAAAESFCGERGITLSMPAKSLCGDNGAMIAAQAYYEYLAGNISDTTLNAHP